MRHAAARLSTPNLSPLICLSIAAELTAGRRHALISLRTMSEAKTAEKRRQPVNEIASALLELFELLVANARDSGDNITTLGEWADEWKPRLEKVARYGAQSSSKLPEE